MDLQSFCLYLACGCSTRGSCACGSVISDGEQRGGTGWLGQPGGHLSMGMAECGTPHTLTLAWVPE